MRVLLVGIAVVLLAATLSGCLSDTSPAGSDDATNQHARARLATDEWMKLLTKPKYDGIVNSVHDLTADDGTHLSLTLHLPAGLPDGTKVPALVEFTPYETFVAAEYDLPVVGVAGAGSSWTDYVLRGAAYVEADERGTARSGGCLDFGGSGDRSDAVVFAEWIRAQPWSNGVIVSDGISHPGMGSVVAHASIPGLTGSLAHAPVVSYYRDEWFNGAKFENQANGPAYQAVELVPPVSANPASTEAQAAPCVGSTVVDFDQPDGRFGPVWDDRDLSRHHDAAAAPILLTQGFIDQNVHPDHVQLYWDSLPEDFPKHAIWGYWYHGWPDLQGHPAEDFANLRHRWLDALLFGIDNGLAAEPRVLVEDQQGTWYEGDDWPLEPSLWQTLWAQGDGTLGDAADGKEGGQSYPDTPGALRGAWADAHAAFRTEPLERDTLVNGAPTVDLVASSTAVGTKWVVYLMDEAPDGSWQRVSHGYIDSHQWGGESDWKPMEPGKPYAWTFMLMPTAVLVEKGHRLTLVVASEDSSLLGTAGQDRPCFEDHADPPGCYDPSGIQPSPDSAGRATNTVLTGPEGTRIRIATVDPTLVAHVAG